jgi:hypothetical protein
LSGTAGGTAAPTVRTAPLTTDIPAATSDGFASIKAVSTTVERSSQHLVLVPEEREQNDDWKKNAQKPK